ncbi:hypothetical protein MLD52_16565 [Puniceicoccaceae bacterium K14]|nr:hypothetical protein [Puniceicoccaceae bacterium K14]
MIKGIRPVRLWNKTLACLVGILGIAPAFTQVHYNWDRFEHNLSDDFIQSHSLPGYFRFAYLEEHLDYAVGVQQVLSVAQFESITPDPLVEKRYLLDRFQVDGFAGQQVIELSASPDNRFLLAFCLQSSEGGLVSSCGNAEFVDLNLFFYDLDSRNKIAFFNEHRFAGIDKQNVDSSLFDTYIADGIAAAAFPGEEEYWNALDYRVRTEGAICDFPRWTWNSDGSITVEYLLEVEVFDPQDPVYVVEYLGQEWFAATIEIPGSTEILGERRTPHSALNYISLTPKQGPEESIKIEGNDVFFRIQAPRFYGKRKVPFYEVVPAVMVEGKIPWAVFKPFYYFQNP